MAVFLKSPDSGPSQNVLKYGARNFGALVYDNILNALHVAGAVLWSP